MSAGEPTPRPVDLRERLRALGYLNAPVDRFVLGGASERRSAFALSIGASLRIGLLAGILLGPVAAVGLATQLPELITSLTDAVVMAAYLTVMFGVATAVAALLVVVPAGLLAQSFATSPSFAVNARRVAGAAGVLIFVACLAYLTLWWRAAVTTASSPTPLFSAAVLGVAVAISLVLGHVVMVTALALIARADNTGSVTAGVPLTSWRATLPLAAIAFIGAAALLFAAAPGANVALPSPPLTVVPTGQRVLVIAIDGVDTAVLDRMRDAQALPALSRLLARGDSGMWSDPDRDPARVWTTIATGQPPERHGISALEGRQLTGVDGRLRATSRFGTLVTGATDLIRLTRPTIASGSERRIPTFWEVAARTGLRTSVINWWATWPAAESGEDTGTVLSDRALLRLEQGGPLDSEIAPAALYATLERSWPERRSRAQARAQAAMAAGTSEDIASIVSRSATIDAEIADLASDAALANVDLQVVYLPGLDIAQHGLFAAETGATAAPSAMAARVTAIETYYRFLDGLVADLTKTPRTVILVTQPGRVSKPGPGRIALAGPASVDHDRLVAIGPTSVAATTLYLLGVPLAGDFSGDLAVSLIDNEFFRAHPPRSVPTYGPRRIAPRRTTGQPLDQEMIERMRSLGYVK